MAALTGVEWKCWGKPVWKSADGTMAITWSLDDAGHPYFEWKEVTSGNVASDQPAQQVKPPDQLTPWKDRRPREFAISRKMRSLIIEGKTYPAQVDEVFRYLLWRIDRLEEELEQVK